MTQYIELLQAFASEIEANKAPLDTVKESGGKLLQEKPEMKEEIVPKIQDLEEEFTELQTETSEKGERIFDNNRVNLYEQSVDALDGHIKEVAGEIENEDVDDVKNFTGVQVCALAEVLIRQFFSLKVGPTLAFYERIDLVLVLSH